MKIFRWQGIAGIGLIVILLCGFVVLFLDGIIESTIESKGSETLKTQLDIGSLSTSLFTPSASINKLELANRDNLMENALEIASIKFRLDGKRIFYKKIIIEEMAVEGIAFNKPRKTPAKAYKAPKQEQEKADKQAGKADKKPAAVSLTGRLNFNSPEDILKSEKLNTLEQAETAKKEIEALKTKWQERIKTELDTAFLDQIKQKVKSLEDKVKNLSGGLSALTVIPSIVKEGREIKKDIQLEIQKIRGLKKEMGKDIQQAQTLLANLQAMPGKDFERLKNKYSLDTKGGVKLLGLLLGGQLKEKLDKAWYYYERLSPYLGKIDAAKSGEAETKPARGEGQFIKFKEPTPYPDFLIKHAKLSMNIFDTSIAGELKDLSDNQRVYGKPAVLSFRARQNDKFDQFNLHVKLDRTQAESHDTFELNIKSLKLANVKAGDEVEVKTGVMDIQSRLEIVNGKNLSGEVNINLASLDLSLSQKQESEMTRLISQALSAVNQFYVKAKIKGTVENYSIDIETDLDKIIAGASKKMLAQKIKNFESQLKSAIDSATSGPLGKVVASHKELLDVENILGGHSNSLNDQLQQLTGNILSGKLGGKSTSPSKILKEFRLPF